MVERLYNDYKIRISRYGGEGSFRLRTHYWITPDRVQEIINAMKRVPELMSDQEFEELPIYDDEDEDEPDESFYQPEKITPRNGSGSDPIFGLVLAGAIGIGMIPLINNDAADMRYTIVWGLLALFGVMAWILGNGERIETGPSQKNLGWGIAFGMILGIPLLAFGGTTLSNITDMLFPQMAAGTVLAYLIFVLPIGETLFFRGLLQNGKAVLVNCPHLYHLAVDHVLPINQPTGRSHW